MHQRGAPSYGNQPTHAYGLMSPSIGSSDGPSAYDEAYLDDLGDHITPPNGPSGLSNISQNASLEELIAQNIADPFIAAAIEDDKRRRNTAASARFRLKKKEREAELERTTRDMNQRCEELQHKITSLETENRWLRELITERSRNRGHRRIRARDYGKNREDRRREKKDKDI